MFDQPAHASNYNALEMAFWFQLVPILPHQPSLDHPSLTSLGRFRMPTGYPYLHCASERNNGWSRHGIVGNHLLQDK
jgi:hypothetical protein